MFFFPKYLPYPKPAVTSPSSRLTLYFALAKIWGLPYGVEIVGTISAFDAFLGGLLGISSANYYSEQVQTNVNNDSQDELIEEGVVENED